MAAVAGVAVWRSPLFSPDPLELSALADPVGFRALRAGPVSPGGALFAGLEPAAVPDGLAKANRAVSGDLCGSLFEQNASGTVPVAYFYDYQCPICRRLSPRLRDLQGVTITWHDLANLGPASVIAARAAIAARNQGAFDTFHDRMMRAAFQPTDGYVRTLAESMKIDADRLLADMDDPSVTTRMNLSQAVANRFALAGTPALVIGRTLVVGDVDSAMLNRLVALEREDPGPCG